MLNRDALSTYILCCNVLCCQLLLSIHPCRVPSSIFQKILKWSLEKKQTKKLPLKGGYFMSHYIKYFQLVSQMT